MGTFRTRPAARTQHIFETRLGMSLPYFEGLRSLAYTHPRRIRVIKMKLRIKERQLIVLSEECRSFKKFSDNVLLSFSRAAFIA